MLLSKALPGALMSILAACASVPPDVPPDARLRGTTIALLGEVHDNAEGQRRRVALLRSALRAG